MGKIFYNNFARENSTARSYNGSMLLQNYNLLNSCLTEVKLAHINEDICYSLFNFFQQRTWKQIFMYGNCNKFKYLRKEIKDICKIKKYNYICIKMLKLKQLKKMGFRTSGILLIKLLYFLKLLNLNNFLTLYIFYIFL